jgi:hypothetical protein
MRVLVGCETSGVLRNEFLALGHDAWSCDLLRADDGSNRHIVCDIRDILNDGWDMLAVMHPPCTRLCNSGVRWLSVPPKDKTLDEMWADLDAGAALFSACWNAPIERVIVENPVMHKHAKARIINYAPPTQIVQPWWFGDKAFKATGLYIRGLKPLVATDRLEPPKPGTQEHKDWSAVHRATPSPERGKIRSKTFPGIAKAIASQMGGDAREQCEVAA